MATELRVDLAALREMAATMRRAETGLEFSHRLTGDSTSVLGSIPVGEALRETSGRLARRISVVVESVRAAAALATRVADELEAADAALARAAAGGGVAGVGTGAGAGARSGSGSEGDEGGR